MADESYRTMTSPGQDQFEPAIHREAERDHARNRPQLRCIGILSCIAGKANGKIRIEDKELVIGRDPQLKAVIEDPSVSRKHARITRDGKQFMIEDLGSSNGTHVDGAPIIYCRLHDGDTVQMGQNLFYFERVLEAVPRRIGEAR